MLEYSSYLKSLGGATGSGFFLGMFAQMDARKKQRIKDELGITSIDGFEGIEKLGIPHKFYRIEVGGKYLHCYSNDIITMYNNEGKFLFECNKFFYYNDGMFLVGNMDCRKNITKTGVHEINDYSYALYHEGGKLTEPIFKPYGMSQKFNEFGFTTIAMFGEYGKYAVINKSGEIIIEADSLFEDPYLYGVICSIKNKYINLLTGNVICKTGYGSTMSTDEFMFVKIEKNCVYQISKITGDFIVHGVVPPVKEEKLPNKSESLIKIKKNTEPQPRKQNRNELCNCGSGKKFKLCCINK